MKTDNYRWGVLPALFIILACLTTPLFSAEGEIPDGGMATVNGVVISQGDFDREIISAQRHMTMQGKALSDSQWAEMKKRVLESLIDRELLYQESLKKGVEVEDESVEELYAGLKNRFSSEEEFQIALLKLKTSEPEVRSQLKKRIAIQRFVSNEFSQKVVASEKDTRAYYDAHKESFREPEQVRARHILIRVEPGAGESQKEEARRKLMDIKARLGKGEELIVIAKPRNI